MPKVEIIKQKNYNFLWIDDYLWMWDIPVEQEAQQLLNEQAYGNVLVVGYGLAILQRQLANNHAVTHLTTVELYEEVILANEKEYGHVYGEVILNDFYNISGDNSYDCVIGDIWEDIAPLALEKYNRFVLHANSFVRPGGKILDWGQEFFVALNSQNKTAIS